MCGLFGHLGPDPVNLKRSRRSLNTLVHRGPDQWGDWSRDGVYLGHRRLSILDLSEHGRQPMVSADESLIVCANGEIYNHEEIRRDLEADHAFQSTSDSEVLLHGYRAYGIERLLEKLEGMYAFVIYDQKTQKLYLARDRVGVKPLYYASFGNRFAWASELKALEDHFSERSLEMDGTALYDFLTYLYVPTPKTLYRGIYKLEPAHYLDVDVRTGRFENRPYWNLPTKPCSLSVDEAAEELRALVRSSVSAQLMSDVPVGFFLSGGIDSSIVVAEASKLSSAVHTYSIGFDVEGYSETEFARIVADLFKTKHTERVLEREDVASSFDQLKEWYDEPFADTSAFPTHLVSTLAKENSTVVLTGDGGDELFGGYRWYDQYLNHASLIKPEAKNVKPRGLRSWFEDRLDDSPIAWVARGFRQEKHRRGAELYAWTRGRMLRRDKEPFRRALGVSNDYDDYWHYQKFYREDLPVRTRAQYIDFHTYLPDQILTKVDRASMAVSLEARVPLLSTRLIEFGFSLPEGIRYDAGRLKGIMKRAYSDHLPEIILNRPKKGFSIPLKRWKHELLAGEDTRQVYILKNLFDVAL